MRSVLRSNDVGEKFLLFTLYSGNFSLTMKYEVADKETDLL